MRAGLMRMFKSNWKIWARNFSIASNLKKPKKALQHTECLVKLKETFKLDEGNEYVVPLFKKSLFHADKIAVKDILGEYTYLQLYMSAKKLSIQLSNFCGSASSSSVIHFTSNNVLSPMVQWACWMSGQVLVPLDPSLQKNLLKRMAENVEARILVSSVENEELAQKLCEELEIPVVVIDHNFIEPISSLPTSLQTLVLTANNRAILANTLNNDFYAISNALIFYNHRATSENRKAVVLTHKNVDARLRSLVNAWKLTTEDTLLFEMPPHETSGILNTLMAALSVGAKVIMSDLTPHSSVWRTLLGLVHKSAKDRINVFVANSEIYKDLVDEYERIFLRDGRMVDYIESYLKTNCRLMVSCGAPMPVNLAQKWRRITTHKVLQNYETCETGMILTNDDFESDEYKKFHDLCQFIGVPLSGVQVRVENKLGKVLVSGDPKGSDPPPPDRVDQRQEAREIVGEFQIAGPTVFKGYYDNGKSGGSVFTNDGFFKTGETAIYKDNILRVLSRELLESDVITVGNEKVPINILESKLSAHPNIKEVAVVGVPDPKMGELIGIACVAKKDSQLDEESISLFWEETLPTYKLPKIIKFVEKLPSNKAELIKLAFNKGN